VSPITGDPRLNLLNRGKRSVAVDLKHPRGAEVVLALAERADVLIEGWRPGVAERLGVGPEAVWARNPKLVYGRMTGWGQEGPLAHSAGHDIAYIAVAGALHPIGRAGGPPQVPVNLVGDFGGGSLYLVVGVLAALREAEATGRGQVVDAAIVDGAAHLTTMVHSLMAGGRWTPNRGANLLDTGAPFYDVYETSDGGHMAVGALEPQFFAELVRLLGLDQPDFPTQYELDRWPEMRERIAAVFVSRTREEWTKVFSGTDACVAPVLSVAEAPHDPHLVARGTYEERDGVVQPAPAPRFSSDANGGPAPFPPPLPGEHTRSALEAWGIDGIESWISDGVAKEASDA
jgi:alpha-methylacyl-CoA racemase